MNLPKRNLEQTIQRVSQMRRLGLSLREAYDKQYRLPQWLERFAVLQALPAEQFSVQFSRDDMAALRAGFRKNWVTGNYATIVEMAEKVPPKILQEDHVSAAFAGAAREQVFKKLIE
jgi:hypothetical protein